MRTEKPHNLHTAICYYEKDLWSDSEGQDEAAHVSDAQVHVYYNTV